MVAARSTTEEFHAVVLSEVPEVTLIYGAVESCGATQRRENSSESSIK